MITKQFLRKILVFFQRRASFFFFLGKRLVSLTKVLNRGRQDQAIIIKKKLTKDIILPQCQIIFQVAIFLPPAVNNCLHSRCGTGQGSGALQLHKA